jgi:RimJ/RimL family protein N-acetyltransferase
MAHPYWPLWDLVVRTPRVELRMPTDEDLLQLATLAAGGIHNPAEMPFAVPWTDAASPELERNLLQYAWRNRAEWTADHWVAQFSIFLSGRLVGEQTVKADRFSETGTVSSGSWLGREWQGQGIGKEMRAAMLHLVFAGLGAARAESDAWHDNHASIAVSTALGYQQTGSSEEERRGQPTRQLHFRLSREDWARHRRNDIAIEGLTPVAEWFGKMRP